MSKINFKTIKKDFPVFNKHKSLVYLDTASSSLTPISVINAVRTYYEEYGTNINRGLYKISEDATIIFENTRKAVASFIGAQDDEIIFTSGSTHGINMLAYGLSKNLTNKDNIVLTRLEHHSNIVPWQQISKKTGCKLRFIDLTDKFEIDISSAEKIINSNTKIVSFSTVSNVLGTISPANKIIDIAKKVGAITILDAAQGILNSNIRVDKLGCDFLVFSAHKIYGPSGIGVLYGKTDKLNNLEPLFYGGDMVQTVNFETASFASVPSRFEAGTQNIAGVFGLHSAIKYIEKIGIKNIQEHEREITRYTIKSLKKINKLQIIGPPIGAKRGGIVSFKIDGIHPHDIAHILGKYNIALRGGHHCAMPLMLYLGLPGLTRVSIGIYNDKKDIDNLVHGIKKVLTIFS